MPLFFCLAILRTLARGAKGPECAAPGQGHDASKNNSGSRSSNNGTKVVRLIRLHATRRRPPSGAMGDQVSRSPAPVGQGLCIASAASLSLLFFPLAMSCTLETCFRSTHPVLLCVCALCPPFNESLGSVDGRCRERGGGGEGYNCRCLFLKSVVKVVDGPHPLLLVHTQDR